MDALKGLAGFALFCMVLVISAFSVGVFMLGLKLFGG